MGKRTRPTGDREQFRRGMVPAGRGSGLTALGSALGRFEGVDLDLAAFVQAGLDVGGEVACAMPPLGCGLGIAGAVFGTFEFMGPTATVAFFYDRLEGESVEDDSAFGLGSSFKIIFLCHFRHLRTFFRLRCVPRSVVVLFGKGKEMAGSVWVRLKRHELFLKFGSFVKKKVCFGVMGKRVRGKWIARVKRGD